MYPRKKLEKINRNTKINIHIQQSKIHSVWHPIKTYKIGKKQENMIHDEEKDPLKSFQK